jgi:hypothetical protein
VFWMYTDEILRDKAKESGTRFSTILAALGSKLGN